MLKLWPNKRFSYILLIRFYIKNGLKKFVYFLFTPNLQEQTDIAKDSKLLPIRFRTSYLWHF